VAYAKVGGQARPSVLVSSGVNRRAASTSFPFAQQRRWVSIVLLAICAALAILWLRGHASVSSSIGVRLGGNPSTEQLAALAAKTQPEDVMLYGASWCPNCAAAKQWMRSYGFHYQECDVEKSLSCAAEFQNFKSDGIPYLVVKGHHMKDGFDSDEFVAALSR
jgi:glutaredoxin